MKPSRLRVDVNLEELDRVLDQARQAPLSDADCEKVKGALHALAAMLVPSRSTEKTSAVLPPREESETAAAAATPAPGHGRNGADRFSGGRKIEVTHPTIKHGDRCPECGQGNVYGQKQAKVLVRIIGQAPLAATVYSLERLRCGACGQVFAAPPPEGLGTEKYDETAAAMIALLKYGGGTPFNRLEQLEDQLGIPLPAATQWEIVEEAADLLKPARDELIRQAAQDEVVHNDDTSMRVLRLVRDPTPEGKAERTGVFTTGIVSSNPERKIALFFTGAKHAGENLAEMLKRRAAELPAPIQMCDALSRNVPANVEILLANCLAHGRRQFVEVAANFPDQCRYVLETLGQVYGHDAEARERGFTPEERLQFHQQHSGPVMDQLHGWLEAQRARRQVEPNSGLGKAILYLLRHWHPLTTFLRVPGAPLDNNIVERALKRAVLHRKNALFYRTLNGAQVGDLFMSLIHTCQLCGVNAFEYLTELQRHARELAAQPAQWMPWNYRQALLPVRV
jgi:transposase